MSSKKKIGIVIVVAVLAITFMTVAFLTTQTNTDYYTQIDNRWVTDIAPHGAMTINTHWLLMMKVVMRKTLLLKQAKFSQMVRICA